MAFQFAAQATLSWVVDVDCLLVAAWTTSSTLATLISLDPLAVLTTVQSPTVSQVVTDFYYYCGPFAVTRPLVKIPLFSGSTLFVRGGGQLTCFVYLAEISQE